MEQSKAVEIFQNFLNENPDILKPFDILFFKGACNCKINPPKDQSWGVYLRGDDIGVSKAYCGISYQDDYVFFKLWENGCHEKRLKWLKEQDLSEIGALYRINGSDYTTLRTTLRKPESCLLIIEKCFSKDDIYSGLMRLFPLFISMCIYEKKDSFENENLGIAFEEMANQIRRNVANLQLITAKKDYIQYCPCESNLNDWAESKCHYEFCILKNELYICFHCEKDFRYQKEITELISSKEFDSLPQNWVRRGSNKLWILFEKLPLKGIGVGKKAAEALIKFNQEFGDNIAHLIKKSKGEALNSRKVNDMNQYQKYIDIIKANHNIILHGAPGTGKTYLAKEIAKAFGCTENEVGFVQFHQSYDYTDFVEGLRPNSDLHFGLRSGIFKSFCAQALKNLLESSKTEEDLNKEKENKTFDYCYQYLVQNKGLSGNNKVGDKEIVIENNEIYFKQSSRNRHLKKSNVKLLFEHLLDAEKNVLENVNQMKDKKLNSLIENLTDGETKKLDCYLFRPLLVDLYKVYKDGLEAKIETIDKKKYCFIIDEINRGEMSKIFGELFYSLEPGYRVKIDDLVDGEKREKLVTIRTQYANMNKIPNDFDEALKIYDDDDFGHFFIPENVYIIGTMNDIDRSVESMDFAMRRRFAFEEITAEQSMSMFDDPKSWKDENDEVVNISDEILTRLKNRMRNLNTAILEPKLNLGQAYQIGGAYFLKFAKYFKDGEEEAFANLWNYHLKGLLTEYLRGMPKAADHLKKLKECYDKSIASESSVSSDNAGNSVENS